MRPSLPSLLALSFPVTARSLTSCSRSLSLSLTRSRSLSLFMLSLARAFALAHSRSLQSIRRVATHSRLCSTPACPPAPRCSCWACGCADAPSTRRGQRWATRTQKPANRYAVPRQQAAPALRGRDRTAVRARLHACACPCTRTGARWCNAHLPRYPGAQRAPETGRNSGRNRPARDQVHARPGESPREGLHVCRCGREIRNRRKRVRAREQGNACAHMHTSDPGR